MMRWTLLLATLGVAILLLQETYAYEEVTVINGGTVQGQVSFEGRLPVDAIEKIAIQRNADVCDLDGTGRREVVWVDVDKNNALRGVFVYIDDINAGKHWREPDNGFVMLQKNCRFRPWAMVVKPGLVTFRHDDGDTVLHNIIVQELIGAEKAKPIRRKMFDFAQPHAGDDHREIRPVRDPHLAVSCEAHIFMFGFMLAPEHPYAVVVNENGNYTIDGVPSGEYVLKAWHPRLGVQQTTISVPKDGELVENFTFKL